MKRDAVVSNGKAEIYPAPQKAASVNPRCGVYELFASIFAKEPTVEFLRLLQEERNVELFRAYGIDCLLDIRHLSVEQQTDSLAVEYASLFLVPGKSTLPYESIQYGEGKLWGDSTVEVKKIYEKFGFALDGGFKDMPDHISAELSFLAQLSRLESDYQIKGLEEAKEGLLKVKKYFLKNHLLKWFFSFKNELIKTARLSYYRDMADFLGRFLNQEWDELKGIKEAETDV